MFESVAGVEVDDIVLILQQLLHHAVVDLLVALGEYFQLVGLG